MESPPMDQALRNNLILETICKLLPYPDLMNARIVNRLWNNVANPVFRKRAVVKKEMFLDESHKFLRKESRLRFQALVAKVPLKIFSYKCNPPDGDLLLEGLQTNATWLQRVNKLTLRGWRTQDLNSLLPCVVGQICRLESLALEAALSAPWTDETYEVSLDGLNANALPPDAVLPLQILSIQFASVSVSSVPFDISFLRHCRMLTTFKAELCGYLDAKIFSQFVESWKSQVPWIRSKEVIFSFKYGHLFYPSWTYEGNDVDTRFFLDVMDPFIQLNQPKALTLTHLNICALQTAAPSLPTVNHLTLTMEVLSFKRGMFLACKELPALQKLCVEISDNCCSELKELEGCIRDGQDMNGVFYTLFVMRGLSSFRATLPWSIKLNTAMIALFHGYQPHVSLELELQERVCDRELLKFSIQEFEEALKRAEESMPESYDSKDSPNDSDDYSLDSDDRSADADEEVMKIVNRRKRNFNSPSIVAARKLVKKAKLRMTMNRKF